MGFKEFLAEWTGIGEKVYCGGCIHYDGQFKNECGYKKKTVVIEDTIRHKVVDYEQTHTCKELNGNHKCQHWGNVLLGAM